MDDSSRKKNREAVKKWKAADRKRCQENQILIARFLHVRGPTYGAVIAEELGLSLDHFWCAISHCEYFRIVYGGWGLSRVGREWLAELASALDTAPISHQSGLPIAPSIEPPEVV